ncbi:hypothetical protein HY345_01835 [Candidatus Microgenomates bacterium]|nr:hypothetical protein [Candidatus Microgenomates bacterium]
MLWQPDWQKRRLMSKEINLLPSRELESAKTKKVKTILTFGSPALLVIFILLVIASYSYALVQTAASKDVANKITSAEGTIQSLSDVESYQRGSKIKLGAIKKILGDQIDYSQIVARIEEITPVNASFTNLAVRGDKDISISYNADNSDTVQELVNNLLDANKGGLYFENIQLKNLVYSRESGFLFTLMFRIRSQES